MYVNHPVTKELSVRDSQELWSQLDDMINLFTAVFSFVHVNFLYSYFLIFCKHLVYHCDNIVQYLLISCFSFKVEKYTFTVENSVEPFFEL